MKFSEAQVAKEVTFQELFPMFKFAVEAVEQKEKATVGKTMVDALRPALLAYESHGTKPGA